MKSSVFTSVALFALAATAAAQDQQLGARTKAMGGSYTAFEDDPVSVWLNPAGIATQPDQLSIAYQTYTAYPKGRERGPGDTVEFTVKPVTIMGDPALLPSYIGFVFQVGDAASPLAIGICYAQPYLIDYAMDQVKDPNQPTFVPEAEVQQVFGRFRVSVAKDFRIQDVGTPGFFTHVSGGVGIDLGYERWHFSGLGEDTTTSNIGFGFGLGGLLGVYDDYDQFKVNFGVAYTSAINYDFRIDPSILPAFDMPQQLNVGATFYLLKGTPLRVTIDFQWIDWSATAQRPQFSNFKGFQDAKNYSMGVEYRVKVTDKISLYPRLGYRRFDAPWSSADNLPMTGPFRLVLDTKAQAFNLVTYGAGISWTTESGKVRSVDIAGDAGGDAINMAVGLTLEF
jgi:long-subunit fatty acid transport protein